MTPAPKLLAIIHENGCALVISSKGRVSVHPAIPAGRGTESPPDAAPASVNPLPMVSEAGRFGNDRPAVRP